MTMLFMVLWKLMGVCHVIRGWSWLLFSFLYWLYKPHWIL